MDDKKTRESGGSANTAYGSVNSVDERLNPHLTLTYSVKNVLPTNFGISEADATNILDEASSQANF